MGNPDEIMGQVVSELLKLDVVDSVEISKNRVTQDGGYVVLAFYSNNARYVQQIVSLIMVQSAIDLPSIVVYEFKKHLNLKGEKE